LNFRKCVPAFFTGLLHELSRFGRAVQCRNGRFAAGHNLLHGVEVAGADECLVTDGGNQPFSSAC
jgi:hypothetical protein